MSDILQLVVEIRNPQAMILLVTSAIRVPNIDDNLKQVGHRCATYIVALSRPGCQILLGGASRSDRINRGKRLVIWLSPR
jgi:hypothetical protein